MGSDWTNKSLDALGRIVTGKTPPSSTVDAFGGSIPFVTPSDMDGTRIISTTARTLSASGQTAVRNAVIPKNAVMVSCIGSDMGKAAIAGIDCITNQQINSIIIDTDDSPLFVYYNLSTRKSEIRGAASGSAQPILNKSAFGRLEIELPPPREQRAIAHILGTLDDKIELNRKQNETLEAMARALFKAWFVDFEPVRAKMEGRWVRGQSLPGLPAHLFDLFPDKLVESELGDIPEGWEMRSLDSIANYLNGLALQKFPPESETEFLPVIKIAQLRAGNTSGADKASTQIKPEYVVVDGDVLFSWSGSLEVEVWNGGKGALNQHLFKVTSNEVPKWFYFFATRHHLSDFRTIAAGKATTMGHIQRKHLTDARIAVAPLESMEKFDAVIAPLFNQLVSNAQQSRSLAQLRDTLLPKLISGELRVPDAERIVGEAV
jgi:type I restriction enzyme S subunit